MRERLQVGTDTRRTQRILASFRPLVLMSRTIIIPHIILSSPSRVMQAGPRYNILVYVLTRIFGFFQQIAGICVNSFVMSGPCALNWTFYLYRQLLSGLLRISTIITDDADKTLDNHNGDLNIFHKFYFNRHAILIQASTFKFNNSCFGPFLSTEINSPVSYTTHYTRHHGCQLHSNTKYNIAHISHEMYFVIGCRQYRIFLLASCVTYEAW